MQMPADTAQFAAVPAQAAHAATGDVFPLLPGDARVTVDPPGVRLDGMGLALEPAGADRLRRLAPSLNGRVPLRRLPGDDADARLVRVLLDTGFAYNLPADRDTVDTARFCAYLYARIGRWRTAKSPARWPWRQLIASGGASVPYLQGIVVENYHYVRAAAVRQSPLLSRAATQVQFDLVREFVTGEACHESYFAETLRRWGVPESLFQAGVPLASTEAFISLQYRLAHRSLLDYLAGSAVLEVNPDVYLKTGDPYQQWEQVYGVPPHILEPVRRHIRDDVASGHASLYRQVATDAFPGRMPLGTAVGALHAARVVFEATRLWQRDMYEHYQVAGAMPASPAL